MGKYLNLNNRKFGKLRVLRKTNLRNKCGGVYWLCKCECGRKRKVVASGLTKLNGTKSCPSCARKGWKNSSKSRIKIYCLACGKEFEIKQYRIGEAKFCSRSCNAKYHYNPRIFTMKNKKPWNKKLGPGMRRLSKNLGQSIRQAIKRQLKINIKKPHWEKLVGYTTGELKQHLENNFQKGMSWENYGQAWNIDHIIPISAFNFKRLIDRDVKKCWALSNLQPLFVKENFKKGSKLIKPFQPSLAF